MQLTSEWCICTVLPHRQGGEGVDASNGSGDRVAACVRAVVVCELVGDFNYWY